MRAPARAHVHARAVSAAAAVFQHSSSRETRPGEPGSGVNKCTDARPRARAHTHTHIHTHTHAHTDQGEGA